MSVGYRLKKRARWLFSRWPIAEVLNRSSRTCWANLVTWALDGRKENLREIGVGYCQRESSEHPDRRCYCGKFADGGRS